MNTHEPPVSFSAFYAAIMAGWPELPDNANTAELVITLMTTLDCAVYAARLSLPPIVDGGPNEGTGFPSY